MSNKDELLPSEIALKAIEEKYPADKQFEPHYYLPKNLITLLRAAADWGIHWGWENPLPWKVKEPPQPAPNIQEGGKTSKDYDRGFWDGYINGVKACSTSTPETSSPVVQPDDQKVMDKLVWKIIEHFQTMRNGDDECMDKDEWSDKVLSYNDVEVELYSFLEDNQKPADTGMSQEDFDRQTTANIPKMSDELAALSDIAALEYSKKLGRTTSYPYTGADICEAHEAGQSWMYHKMQEEITTYKEMWRIADKTMNELRLKIQQLHNKYSNS